MVLRARWLPRLQNQEADDLTNDEFRHFDMRKRIHVDFEKIGFAVMDALFAEGDTYLAELEAARNANRKKLEDKKAKAQERLQAKGHKKLRESDPL